MSVSLMAMAMQAMDVPAVSLNAFQVMMHCTSRYGNARFKRVDTERIQHELDSRKIVIVTGFQGVNKYDDITTLGREALIRQQLHLQQYSTQINVKSIQM